MFSVKKFLPDSIRASFCRTAVVLTGAAVSGFGVLLAAALMTYHPTDPSFNTATGDVAENIAGSFGSHAADLLWQYTGLGSLLFPAAFVAWGIIVMREKWHRYQILRVLCFFPTLLLALIFLSVFPNKAVWPVYAGLSGAVMPAFYDPAIALLKKLYVPFIEYAIQPVVFVALIFSAAATLGIPFYLIKRWIAALWRGVKALCARVFRRREPENEEAEEELPDELPESLLAPVQAELPLPESPQPAPKKIVKKVRPNAIVEAIRDKRVFHLPKIDFLAKPKTNPDTEISAEYLEQRSRQLESVLKEYGVKGRIVAAHPGPVVTLFELEPVPGTKTTRVIGLAEDIARSMSALSVRIAVIPGQSVIGIEMPNEKRADVYFREMVSDPVFKNAERPLTMALGKDIGGKPTFTDLAKMPHLLIAGTTGSGKSVAINTMILSLLFRLTPEQCRMIMIDPKMLELSVYNGIPHLLTPVVTDPKKSVLALNWAVREMDERYRLMSEIGVRNIDGYNTKIKEMAAKGQTTREVLTGHDENGEEIWETQEMNLRPFPYIVVIVDEMADLMLTAGKDIEVAVQRIAQKARAAGIHLIMATQRPSVDVITGTIKANFPERISFRVTSKIDSRTILGEQGAEQLLGRGDMLYLAQGQRAVRLHGPFVSDAEVEEVASYLRSQGTPQYVSAVVEEVEETVVENGASSASASDADDDEASLYDKAVDIVLRDKKPTISYLQRRMSIGYNRAADLIEQMEHEGVISAPNAAGKRSILVPDHRNE